MNCVIPFYQGDVKAVIRLLKWIKRIEGCVSHDCVLVADAATRWDDCQEIQNLAKGSFNSVELIATDESVTGWPQGPNELFINAAMHMNLQDKPWLWLEPDAVPLRPLWLDMIEQEYKSCGKPYLGAVMHGEKGFKQLAGVAVYPSDAIVELGRMIHEDDAFDMTTAEVTVPKSAHSKRIQHFWGQHELSPTFSKTKTELNAFTLDDLTEGAVLFHRNKDGTLINILWEKMYPSSSNAADILLVVPFWNGDASGAINLLKWMGELNPRIPFDVLLTYDNTTINVWIAETEAMARRHFRNVYQLKRPAPPSTRWPVGPNFSFQTTAIHILHTHNRPWFWMEPDAIPLKPNWLDTIAREYERCDRPFFGPIVKQFGHMNGVAVYPADFPLRCPNTMKVKDAAFDHVMKHEMIHDCCDASPIIQHIWGVENGMPSEVSGDAPSFKNRQQLSWLDPDAVIMHRCKDGSLINILRERR